MGRKIVFPGTVPAGAGLPQPGDVLTPDGSSPPPDDSPQPPNDSPPPDGSFATLAAQDSFEGASGTSLAAHVPGTDVIGGGWVDVDAMWSLNGAGRAVRANPNEGKSYPALINVGAEAHEVRLEIPNWSNRFALLFAATGNGDAAAIVWGPGSEQFIWALAEAREGAESYDFDTSVDASLGYTPGSGTECVVRYQDGQAAVLVGGAQVSTYAFSRPVGATFAGMGEGAISAASIRTP